MSDFSSCLYVGEVTHQRFAPTRHRLRYRMFQTLIDLDELPELSSRLRLFSYNRFNALAFHDSDHGDHTGVSLRHFVDRTLAKAGLSRNGGAIKLLCMPRIFGHVFNPLSIYYCYDRDGAIFAMIYEVKNTFGECHVYLIPVICADEGSLTQTCDKAFYVSPFMDMDMGYEFKISAAGETISTVVNGKGANDEPLIFAGFNGRRVAISDASVLGVLFAYPFLTLGVVIAIHWEALKLFAKGLRVRPRTPVGRAGLTVVSGPTSAPVRLG